MRIKGNFQRLCLVGVLAGVATVGLVAVPGGATVKAHTSPSGSLTFPAVQADWTYPFTMFPLSEFNTENAGFSDLDTTPLYQFAAGNQTSFNQATSLANLTPSWTGDTVKVQMLGRHWSNGEQVNAQSALFWINLEKYSAHSGSSSVVPYGAYAPGVGIPDQVKSASASGNTLTITFNSAVNHTWALENALQVVTPLPLSWDVYAGHLTAGSGGCSANLAYSSTAPYALTGTGLADCARVYTYLNGQSGGNGGVSAINSTEFNNPIWKVSDGPYVLSAIHMQPSNIGGALPTFVANTHYDNGTPANVETLNWQYFSSTTAEVSALEAGGTLATGGVPSEDTGPATITSSNETAGSNSIGSINNHYNVEIGSNWGSAFAYINGTTRSVDHLTLTQPYIREALNLAVDQKGLITTVFHGYGLPECNVLPPQDDPWETQTTCQNSATANTTAATNVLTSHGWKLNGSGVMACIKSGTASNECGLGIRDGAQLNISMDYFYSAGSDTNTEVGDIGQEWSNIGFNVTLTGYFTAASIGGQCFTAKPTYDVCLYGGWVYNPGVFVSGEQFLLGGSGSNANQFNNSEMNCAILNTITFTKPSSCSTYHYWNTTSLTTAVKNYAAISGYEPASGTSPAGLAPYLYLPNNFLAPLEVNKDLTWTGPTADAAFGGAKNDFANPVDNFLPQFYSL